MMEAFHIEDAYTVDLNVPSGKPFAPSELTMISDGVTLEINVQKSPSGSQWAQDRRDERLRLRSVDDDESAIAFHPARFGPPDEPCTMTVSLGLRDRRGLYNGGSATVDFGGNVPGIVNVEVRHV